MHKQLIREHIDAWSRCVSREPGPIGAELQGWGGPWSNCDMEQLVRVQVAFWAGWIRWMDSMDGFDGWMDGWIHRFAA